VILALTAKEKKIHTPPSPQKDAVPKRWFVGLSFKEFLTFLQAEARPMAPPSMARIVSRCMVCFAGLIDLLPVEDLTACATLVL